MRHVPKFTIAGLVIGAFWTFPLFAAPTIGTTAVTPTSIPLATATQLTITAQITDPTLLPGGVNLQQLDTSGRVTTILGILHDDGLNGDAVAGDNIYTLQISLTPTTTGPISLRVSAAFKGLLSRVFSPVLTVTVTGNTAAPTVFLTTPINLSYLNLSPTTVSGTVSDPNATVTVNGLAAPVGNGQFSLSVPLSEGPNIITATATNSGGASTASIEVTLDTTPPHVTITSPSDQFTTTDAAISVAGNVNDIVVGTVNSQQASVAINGVAATVANRTFLATAIPLNLGTNTIQAVAHDQSGNAATTQITVIRTAPQPNRIQTMSGNNQTGVIGTALATPLTIQLIDSTGQPAPNKPVIFTVTQDNGMLATAGGTPAASVIATTDANGQATASWTLGMRSGAGSDAVQAYSVGFTGTAMFTATATQGKPGMIVVDSGNNQTGAVTQPLPKPLIVVVVDAGHNRLPGIPVAFTVMNGGGSFTGQSTFTATTDSDGRAGATLTLGFQEGSSNNLISATFPNNTSFPASFTASALATGNPGATVISGIVIDNSNQPIPGVSVRAVLTDAANASSSSTQTAATVQTDATGAFSIYQAPVGYIKLMVDGSTATATGTYPSLEYDMVTVPGQINTVGQPIHLLAIKTTNQLCVTATTGGGTLTIPEAPGFSLTFGPGQVTFPGGSKTGCVSVTSVHPDKVPMVPGFGQQPRFIVTIQPSGAFFNPPAPIALPNVDGLQPREVTEMYSFDHDINSFVAIGTGTVSDDGQVVRSNPGIGVLKAGWHCGGNPNAGGSAATCGPCASCNGTNCVPNPVQGGPCQNTCISGGSGTCTNGYCTGPVNVGAPCGNGGTCDKSGNCVFGGGGGGCPSCNSGNPCIDDSCVNGQCKARPNQLCQMACNFLGSGATCAVGNLSGVCDPNGNCNLCSSLGSGASCTCAGGGLGTCSANGQCSGCPSTVQLVWRNQPAPQTIFIRQGTVAYQSSNGTLSAEPSIPGGTFTWTTSNPNVLSVATSGDHIAVLGTSIGSSDVTVSYVDPNGHSTSAKATVNVIYPIVLVHGFNSDPVGAWGPLSGALQTQNGLLAGDYNCNALKSEEDLDFCAVDFCDEVIGGVHVQPSFFCPYGGSLPQWGSFSSFIDEGFALSTMIQNLRNATGADKVTLVAHSMGGLASRAYLQIIGGGHVYRFITTGTPNTGTPLASLAVDPILIQSPSILLYLAQRAIEAGSPAVIGMSQSPLSHDLSLLNGLFANTLPPETQYVSVVGQDSSSDGVQESLAWTGLVTGQCAISLTNPICQDLVAQSIVMTPFFRASDVIVPTSSQDLRNAVPVPRAFCLVSPPESLQHSPLLPLTSSLPETRDVTLLLELLDLTGINPCIFP